MFGMFFLGALYLQRVLHYSALEVGLAFLPTTIVMGALSLGFAEKLIMRFGARTTMIPGVALVAIALLPLRHPHPGRRQLPDRPAAALPADRGRDRHRLPGDHDPGDVGRDPAGRRPRLRAWSTPACRSAARSAWRSWRRSPPSAPNNLIAGGASQASALTSGYHLAYLVGAGLAVIAVLIAIFVIQPTPTPAHAGGADRRGGRRRGTASRARASATRAGINPVGT